MDGLPNETPVTAALMRAYLKIDVKACILNQGLREEIEVEN